MPRKSKIRHLKPLSYPQYPTHQNLHRNFCGLLILAYFPAKYIKFQIFVDQSVFVVQKHLIYKKSFIFDGKYDAIKIKWFTYVLSNLLNRYKKSKNEKFLKSWKSFILKWIA